MTTLVLLRLVHVVLGAVWVGMAVFTAFFLTPAFQDAAPDGAKVMAALQRRGMMTVMPILALGTLLSGIWLYWRVSGGFQAGYVTSPGGLTFGLGGAAALLAYGIGMTVMRPSMLRAVALSQTLGPTTTSREREERMAEIQRLRARGAAAGRWVAGLLVAAVAAMAVGRYV
jgi:uncharacterized membrane protein